MEEKKEIKDLQKLVSEDFADSSSRSLIPNKDFAELEKFRLYLIDKLKDMYDKNYDSLINTLYRIDVSESRLSELFSSVNRNYIPEKLADLIIERQLQKIKFRKQYREGRL